MRPIHVLLFLLAVMVGLAVIGSLVPAEGIRLGDTLTLRLPSAQQVLFPEPKAEVDISDILAVTTDSAAITDTEALADSLMADALAGTEPFVFDSAALRPLEERIALHYPNDDKQVLWPLFAQLQNAHNGTQPIRIMHYGDSQLEGDRITSYIRNKLQSQFGGSGPGLFSVADIVNSFSIDRIISDNWLRYSVMGRKDPTQHHARYGALSSFSRFTPILPDSIAPDTVLHEATITLRPLRRAYGKAQQYSTCELFYGWHRAPVTIELRNGEELVSSEVVQPTNSMVVRQWKFTSTPSEITITFSGADSPDVFGIALDGRSGLGVDNIAARGGAGYEFRKADQTLLGRMYKELDVKLLILQYGGNVLPNLKNAEEAAQYGRYFGAQIARFRKMIPGVSVIVIGPSDMSIKEGENYVTRPYLEEVRDALKSNSLAQGAVFWDMYEAMGGRNSMPAWVEADPPLAATDYTHFSPQGSKKVGELFYTALINDFAAYYSAAQ
ncbi:MAG TPA: GDSL-type esterase/lipase family protein [Flavobacteriales bacterium]|jgi:lysophospholipase L1-like esterase|nr:GDSL-type esterase/lipase family protein [Flavobacteriales bacterium]HQW40566.1 GDSL-type esterase/lipase family protein [Flavobacteriales bacterium]